MSQSRRMSVVETAASTAIGFGISYIVSLTVLPLFGFPVTHGENFAIVCIFTIASLARGYVVRRLFNAWHRRVA